MSARPTSLSAARAARNPALLAAVFGPAVAQFAAGDQVAVTFDGALTALETVKYADGSTVWLTSGSGLDIDARGRFDGGVVEKVTAQHRQALERQELVARIMRAPATAWLGVDTDVIEALAGLLGVRR